MALNARVLVRLFLTRGRLPARDSVGRLGYLRGKKGMTRTSPNAPTMAAPRSVIASEIAGLNAWDSSGEMGRLQLSEIVRRAEHR